MAELLDVQRAGNVPQPYTPKQLFGKLKTFEGIADTVMYVPFVYTLIRDKHRLAYTTDMFSHSLSQVLGSHPLVVHGLDKRIFETMPPILLTGDQKIYERTLYISPKEAWNRIAESLKTISAVDRATRRFCIFRMYEEEIPCPLGNYADKMIKVWFCNLYGNQETYYFAQGLDQKGQPLMQLYYAPPIREFVQLGDKLLGMLQEEKSEEKVYETFAADIDQERRNIYLFALQKNSKLQKTLEAKPLEESQLTAKQRADCYEMIKMYYQIYPDTIT